MNITLPERQRLTRTRTRVVAVIDAISTAVAVSSTGRQASTLAPRSGSRPTAHAGASTDASQAGVQAAGFGDVRPT
jgi:hypothetical protein